MSLLSTYNTEYITNNPDISKSYGLEKTLSFCVKQTIIFAYTIYAKLLQEANDKNKITIACGGQSPAYYCLAMLQLKIYSFDMEFIIVLLIPLGTEFIAIQIIAFLYPK